MNDWKKYFVLLVFVAALLNGCATAPEQTVSEETTLEQQIRPDTSTRPAVRRLIEKARLASQAGDMSRAETLLERAIRIEPANPYLWHYLAKLHLHQGHYQRAEGLATKSTSLSKGEHHRLEADNWRIVAHARQYQGDTQGAQAAQSRATTLTTENP